MKFKTIFFNYVIRYFLGFLILFFCSTLVAQTATESLENYLLERIRLKTQEGVSNIRNVFSKMDLITQIISKNKAFTTLTYQKGVLAQKDVIKLRDANRLFNEIGFTADYSPYMFTLFANNDLYVSSNQCSFHFTEYYSRFLKLNTSRQDFTNGQSLKDFLFSEHAQSRKIIPLKQIQFISDGKLQQLDNPLLYLSQHNAGKHSLYLSCFVLDQSDIIRYLLMSELGGDSFLVIQDQNMGRQILEYGQIPKEWQSGQITNIEKSGYHVLSYVQEELQWKVIIGLSHSFVHKQLQPVRRLLLAYLVVGMLLAITLTIYFSWYRYRNFKQVLFALPNDEEATDNELKIDEYGILINRISDLKKQRNRYRLDAEQLIRQNEAILLEHLIISGIKTKEERVVFEKCFARQPEFFCVAIVRVKDKFFQKYEALTLEMVDFLENHYYGKFANVYTGVMDELFLFEINAEQEANVSEIRNLFEKLIAELSVKYQTIFHVGISTIGTDIANINKCYEQAKQILQAQYLHAHENMIKAYDISLNTLYTNPVNLEFLNRFHTLLLCGQKEEVLKALEKIESYFERMPYFCEMQKDQVYYAIRNVLYSAWLSLGCSGNFDAVVPPFDAEHTPVQFFGDLRCAVIYLTDFISQNKKSQNEELKDKIIDYLKNNYQNAGLSAHIVSSAMGISEKYLFHFFKEHTGETFANYLLHIRIEKAKEYLSTQAWSNEKIAVLTGFGSVNTFYRNFKTQTGVSPKVYQERNSANSDDLIYPGTK